MLVIDISINRNKFIEEIGIVRIPNKEGHCDEGCTPLDDDVFTYKYGFIQDGKIPKYLGELEHRYGDCGLQLAASVMKLISENDTPEFIQERKDNKEALNFERLMQMAGDLS